MSELTTANETDTPVISVAEFARMCVDTAKRSHTGLSVTDAICKTSINYDFLYHLGWYEYNQAKKEVIKLIRMPQAATQFDGMGNPLNAKPRGKHNNLLGKKIFCDQDRGRIPIWAGTTKPMKSNYDTPTGRDHPIVQEFIKTHNQILNNKFNSAYSEAWLMTKIRAAPKVRDDDLGIAVFNMKETMNELGVIKGELAQIRALLLASVANDAAATAAA